MHERKGARQGFEQGSNCSRDDIEYFRWSFRQGNANQTVDDNWDHLGNEFLMEAFNYSPEDRNPKFNCSIFPNELNRSEDCDPVLQERTLQELKKHACSNYKNKFPLNFKKLVVSAKESAKINIKEIMEATGLCKKNIERWIAQGVERKKGAGRKTMNREMENEIVSKVLAGIRESGCLSRKRTSQEGDHGNGQKVQIGMLQSFKRVVR